MLRPIDPFEQSGNRAVTLKVTGRGDVVQEGRDGCQVRLDGICRECPLPQDAHHVVGFCQPPRDKISRPEHGISSSSSIPSRLAKISRRLVYSLIVLGRWPWKARVRTSEQEVFRRRPMVMREILILSTGAVGRISQAVRLNIKIKIFP